MIFMLPKLLREREGALENRERELDRLKAELELEHNFGQPSDVLRLSVGGTCFDVLRRTLTQVEGSMLASLVGAGTRAWRKTPMGISLLINPLISSWL